MPTHSEARLYGPILLPTGATPTNGQVIFELTGWDQEEDAALFVSGPWVADIDDDGYIDLNLWSTATGDNNVSYKMYVTYLDPRKSTLNYQEQKTEYIGQFSLVGAGPFYTANLNIVDNTVASTFDLYAEMVALNSAAEVSATNAAAYGSVYSSRVAAETTSVASTVEVITVFHDGVPCLMQTSTSVAALTTADGGHWKPAEGGVTYLQAYGVSTHATKELARAAVTAMTTLERTVHQAAIERAYLDTVGDLVTDGWVEALDMPIVGPRCVPCLLDGVAGEQLEGGFFLTSRFNVSATACVQGGATGSGSYAPYIKSMSIALDQSEAETAGQIAYDAHLVSNPGDTVGADDASDAAIPAALIQYPRPFLGKEAFGVIETLQVTGVADDPVSWTAPEFVDGSGNPDNIGGWEIKKLQISGVGQDLTIENGFHHVVVGYIDLWVKDLTPRLMHYRNRKVSPGIARKAMHIGRLDRLECKSLYIFGGGEIEMDKGDANSITDTIGLTLDGDDNSFLHTSGSTHLPEGYASENTAAPRQKYKMRCAGGRLSVGSEYRMVGDSEAMLDVIAGETRYHGMIHVTDVNSHAVKVSGTGKAIMDGAHFRLENAPWNVGPLEQFGPDAQLIVLDNCTADVRTVVAGVVTYVPIDLHLICKFNDFNVGNYIADAPRTREAMMRGLGNVVWAVASGGDDLSLYQRMLTNVSSRDGGTGVITTTGTGAPTTTVTALYGDATTQTTRIAADGTYSMVSEAGKPADAVVLTCVQTQYQYPIKGSRVYRLPEAYRGNATAAAISDLLGLQPLDDYSPTHFGWTAAQDATTQREKVQAMIDAVPANGGNIRFTKNTITPDAPLRATDGIYPGWVANDEMRRANKAFIVFNRKNINFYFDEGAVIDRSGDQIADTDYAVYASTFYVSKSENVWFHNPQIIGYQDDAALLADNKDQTSGDAIQFNNGCDYVGVIGGHLKDGTSGVTVGYNRTAAEASFDPALAPVTNFRMIGTLVEGFEHKTLLSDVDGFEVDLVGQGWTRANASVSETQRGVYLEGCKNGTVKTHLWDVFKTSLLVGNKGVENVTVDLWVHSMKTNDAWVADTGSSLDTVYTGIAATFATETAKNVTVNIHKARSATTVTMSEVGHKDITLNLGDCHAAFAGVRTLTQITDQTALVDNPITGLKLTGQVLVDATLTGYSGLTPNTGLLINSAAVDGSGDPVFGEVLLDNLSVKSTNRNARVLNFNGAVNGGEFLQTRGQTSARSYDFNYNGDINFTGQTVISDDREFNGPSDGATLISNVVQFFSAMKAKLWSIPYNGQNGLAPIANARTGRQMHRLAGKMQMVSPHQNQQDSLAHYEVEVVPATGGAGVETETRALSFNISGKDLPDAGHSIRGLRGEAIGDGGSAKVRAVRTNAYGVNGHDGLLVGALFSAARYGLIPTSLGGNGTTDVFADGVAGPFGSQDAGVIAQVGPGIRYNFLAQGAPGGAHPQYAFLQAFGGTPVLPEIATFGLHAGGVGDIVHLWDDEDSTVMLAAWLNDGSMVLPSVRGNNGDIALVDNAFHVINVPAATGFFRLWSAGSITRYCDIVFRATASAAHSANSVGSSVEIINGDTGGTSGKLVVYIRDGSIRVENLLGATVSINWAFNA